MGTKNESLPPAKASKSPATATTRVYQDIATMLSGIIAFDPAASTAAILDPLIRPELERRYAELPAFVRRTVEERAKKSQAAQAAKGT